MIAGELRHTNSLGRIDHRFPTGRKNRALNPPSGGNSAPAGGMKVIRSAQEAVGGAYGRADPLRHST